MFLILWKIGRLEISSFIWNFTDRKEMMSKTCNVYIVSRNAFSNLEIRRLDPGLIIKKGLSGNIWCFSKSGLNPHLNYSLMTVDIKIKNELVTTCFNQFMRKVEIFMEFLYHIWQILNYKSCFHPFPRMAFITYYIHSKIISCVKFPVEQKFARQNCSHIVTFTVLITRNSPYSQNFKGRNVLVQDLCVIHWILERFKS